MPKGTRSVAPCRFSSAIRFSNSAVAEASNRANRSASSLNIFLLSSEQTTSVEALPNGSSVPQNHGYLRAGREDKPRILDEFVALTGYHSKVTSRLLCRCYSHHYLGHWGRLCYYILSVEAVLLAIWACRNICSKRLAPFLPKIMAVIKKRHGQP